MRFPNKIPFFFSLFLIFVTSLFVGCSNESSENSNRIETSGMADIAVVSNEQLSSGLSEIFSNKYDTANLEKHLPHSNGIWGFETMFNYIMLNGEDEQLAKNNRLVLFFGTKSKLANDLPSKKLSEGELKSNSEILGTYKIYENVWGKGQQVALIELNSDVEQAIENHNSKDNLTSLKLKNVSKAIQDLVKSCHNQLGLKGSIGYSEKGDEEFKYTDSITKLLKKNYGFSFFVPNSFRIVQADSTFIWLTRIKSEGGYEAIMININQQPVDVTSIKSLVENRNNFTTKYLHNDEGTKIVVSESGAYNPFFGKSGTVNKHPYTLLNGWYTELGTFRRGPFGRYIFQNGQSQVAFDWFAGGSDRYNSIKAHLDLIAQSFKFEQ